MGHWLKEKVTIGANLEPFQCTVQLSHDGLIVQQGHDPVHGSVDILVEQKLHVNIQNITAHQTWGDYFPNDYNYCKAIYFCEYQI